MVKTVVPADLSGIGAGLDFIEEALKEYKFQPKFIRESMLLSEESMVRLIDNSVPGGTIHIHVKKKRGLATISLSAPGAELSGSVAESFDIGDDDVGRENESAIRGILLKAYEDKIRYARKGKYNFIEVTVGMPEKVFAVWTLGALVAALITGFVLQQFLPASARIALDSYLLDPIEQIFLNLLRLVAAPTVFFSIMINVANYSSFSDPGRVSIKTFVSCGVTSLMAMIVGVGVFRVFQPGIFGALVSASPQTAVDTARESIDYIGTLVNIVPSNIIDPFRNVDTLQLIFLALVCGVAMGRIGDYSATLRNMVEALNTLFAKVVSILMNIIPVVVFASTVSMMISIGNDIIISVAEMVGALVIGILIMILLYCALVLTVARVSPLKFLKKYYPTMKETFILGSGLSALPKTMRCCKNSLGISPKVYSFSIPFGANFNMDGNCVYLPIAALFIARLCGVDIQGSDIVPLIFTIAILSVGAPIAPGTTIICLTVVLNQMGISLTAVTVLFGINAALEMLTGMSNTLGDVVVSLAIARTENLLDEDVFNAKAKVYK